MKVYTYYEQDKELNDFSPLINFWKEKWTAAGHEPVIIDSSAISKVNLLEYLVKHINSLPKITPAKYVENNFVRWLAMDSLVTKLGQGALHVDSDVFPDNFVFPCFDLGKITIWQKDVCPCAVWIPRQGCLDLISSMFDYKKGIQIYGKEHCDDQEFFRWLLPKVNFIKVIDIVKSYLTEPDWKTGTLIHYPTSNLPNGNKTDILKQLLC